MSVHRQANDERDQRLLVGACRECMCAQYVEMGRKVGNGLLHVDGDHGLAAKPRPRVPLPPIESWTMTSGGLAVPRH